MAERIAVQARKIPLALMGVATAISTKGFFDKDFRATYPHGNVVTDTVFGTFNNTSPSIFVGAAIGNVSARVAHRWTEDPQRLQEVSMVAAGLAVSALNWWFESRFGAKFGPFDNTDMNPTDFVAGVAAGTLASTAATRITVYDSSL